MVGTEGRERDDAAHGRDLDDMARALLAQDREDRLRDQLETNLFGVFHVTQAVLPILRDMENAEQVRLELVAQLLLGDLLDRSEEPVARVVDDDVDPPERLVRGLHRSEHLVAVGDVEFDREDGVAVLLDQVTQSVRVAGGRCDLIATLEGGEDELAAKASRCAGDEPNLAHDVNPLLVWTATVTCSAACCWCAGVSVRMVRSLAVCWSIACGPFPVSSRTDGS